MKLDHQSHGAMNDDTRDIDQVSTAMSDLDLEWSIVPAATGGFGDMSSDDDTMSEVSSVPPAPIVPHLPDGRVSYADKLKMNLEKKLLEDNIKREPVARPPSRWAPKIQINNINGSRKDRLYMNSAGVKNQVPLGDDDEDDVTNSLYCSSYFIKGSVAVSRYNDKTKGNFLQMEKKQARIASKV